MKTPKFTLACGFVLLAASLLADVSHRIVDSSLKLTAPAGSAGDRIVFVWDTEDKGDDAAAWAHSAVVTESVPTGGANYTLDLAELGVSNGSACGLISVRSYRCLDQLGTFDGAYVETAYKDSDCHGVAFGFYATAKTSDWGNFIGTKEDVSGDDNRGFLLSLNSANLTSWFYVNNGTRSPERPAVKTDAVNEVSFKDGVFTLNGSTIHSGLATPVGMSGLNMRVGRSQDYRIQSGWWAHVEFAGSDGKNLIEYVPVQQGDGTVGFYDKVSGAFVPPTSGTFTAGTATGETIARVLPHQAFAATDVTPIAVSFTGTRLVADVPARYAGDRLLLLWDEADKGSEIGNWANRYELASVVKKGGGSHVVDLGRLGVRNGQACAVVAVQQYEPLAMLKMTDATTYVDTGVRDSDCYGLSLGFYGNECSGNGGAFCTFIGTCEAGTGFAIGMNSASFGSWYWYYQGVKFYPRPAVKTDSINEVVFANRTFTLNGSTVTPTSPQTTIPAGSVGVSGRNMYLGRWQIDGRYLFGWWSHVSFQDVNGENLIDYIPVKRTVDGKVSFYDRVSNRFVESAGGGMFTAGETVGEPQTVVRTKVNAIAPYAIAALDVAVEGTKIVVKAPSVFAQEQVLLLWDEEDKGDVIDGWTHRQVLCETVPAAGGTFVADWQTLDIGKEHVCRVMAVHRLQLLDMLKMPDQSTYVDTGVPDGICFGIRLGFYGNESLNLYESGFANFIGTGESVGEATPCCFTIGMNNASYGSWYWIYRKVKPDNRPKVSIDSINEVEFADQTFRLNGKTVEAGLEMGPVGETGRNMHLGTFAARSRFLFGWWSHASFQDAAGRNIIDYIPAKRISDSAVGFYDRATSTFVLSTGGGAFTAGTVTNENCTLVHEQATLSLANVVVAATWTGAGTAGKLDDPANWACTNPYGEEITGVPNAFTAVSFASAADFNCPAGTSFGCRSITMSGSLTADRDWRGIDFSAVSGTIDLAGYALQAFAAKNLTAATVTDSVGGGTLTLEVPSGVEVENANVTLTGGLKLAKTGEGVFVAAKKNQSYTGGTEILVGTFVCGGKGSEGVYGAANGTLTVGPGAVFDCNGYNGHAAAKLVLAGGEVVNSKSASSSNDGWFADVTLTADSFARADKGLAFRAASGGSATLEMNGHKLTIDVNPDYTFGLYDLTVTGGGTIYGRSGGFIQLVRVTAETTTLEAGSHSLDVSSPTTFLNYIARYTGNWDKSPGAPIRVLGRFTPVGLSWHSVEFQDGAVLDLSQQSGVWSATCEKSHYAGPSSISFADGATVRLDVGERQPALGDQLVSWPTKPAGARFAWDLGLPLHAKSKGLFVMEPPGMAILVR